MEFKAIFYVIAGLIYLVFTVLKKKGEEPMPTIPPKKAMKPVVSKTVDEILAESRKNKAKPKPAPLAKELFVKEKRTPGFEEGRTNFKTFERVKTDEEKTVEAAEAARSHAKAFAMDEEERQSVTFNAREAFIGSLIFDRKW